MDNPAQILRRWNFVHNAFQEKTVGAAIDEIFFFNQLVDDLVYPRVDSGFSSCDRYDGSS